MTREDRIKLGTPLMRLIGYAQPDIELFRIQHREWGEELARLAHDLEKVWNEVIDSNIEEEKN